MPQRFSIALVALHNIKIAFGGPLVLEDVSFQIEDNERVCLLGRNGEGKSTLLKILNDDLPPDSGSIIRRQHLRVAQLPQQVPTTIHGTVFDIVAAGLVTLGDEVVEYHNLTTEPQKHQNRLDELHHLFDEQEGWHAMQQVDQVIERMKLKADADFDTLSAGMKRRVLLAGGLVLEPHLLLLDEPTNHLDIDSINWLEDFLLNYNGALLFVTHDRIFLQKLASRIVELDRGRLSSWNCDYPTYLERKQAALETQAAHNAQFDKKLAREEAWIRQGIKARRTRNEGRVRALKQLREERRARRDLSGSVRLNMQDADRSGKLVVDVNRISFAYETGEIITDFSTTIMRGDKIGIIGPNGSGKTTLLNILLGNLEPQSGSIKLGTNLKVSYFDQLRAQLDDDQTLINNIADGSDMLTLDGKPRHVISYLQDFLFSPEQAKSPVKNLSGGERNRLLLARLFTRPSNVLVLDEPTNDLDVETLELLEELLLDYSGTLLLVSHDRAFINNVVTSTLVLEGDGRVGDYVGGYDDWLRQRTVNEPKIKMQKPKPRAAKERPNKISFKEKQELEALPQRIEELEHEQHRLYAAQSDPDFYKKDSADIVAAQNRLEEIERELIAVYDRWEYLDQLPQK